MIDLTNPMISAAQTSQTSTRRELCELLPALGSPKSYYHSFAPDVGGSLPQRVILFARRTATSLGSQRERSSHHRHVCVVALEGEGTVCIEAENFRLRAGSALIVQPYQYHGYTDLDRELRWLFVTFEAERGSLENLGNAIHRPGDLEMRLFLEIARCWTEPGKQRLVAWHLGLLLERLGFLPGAYRKEPESEADLLVKVNRYALARLDRVVALEELASAIGLSESHLRAEFRRLTGRALGGHLRHLRLKHACALLHTTQNSIAQIAEACGFDSLYSFSRAFKSTYGIAPRDYRRREHF